MSPDPDTPQRIGRLMPLADLLARIDATVEPVAPRAVPAAAAGQVLAEPLTLPMRPSVPLALRDGWAVASDLTLDASAWTPVSQPAARRIAVGTAMPAGADAVAPLDSVEMRGAQAYILAPVAGGDGVLAAGADIDAAGLLIPAGTLLTLRLVAVLAASGANETLRVRQPVLRLVRLRDDAVIGAACELIAGAIVAAGGRVCACGRSGPDALEDALAAGDADAIVGVGGTGSAPDDAGVKALLRRGRLEAHGLAVTPGETAAFGIAAGRPVLLLPGRIDAALAVWLTVGRRILARLFGAAAVAEDERVIRARLARKIASPLGLAEVIAVQMKAQGVEPIASGYVPWTALATSDGWVLVPAESEGYPAGAEVVIRAWP
jgi:molybdopterin biosynthesis enzyme